VPQTWQTRLLSALTLPLQYRILVDLRSPGLHKIVIGGTSERIVVILQGPNDRKELGRLGGTNYVFRSPQLPIQILKGATEIILLFSNQGGVSEPVNGSDETAHHRVSSCDCSL